VRYTHDKSRPSSTLRGARLRQPDEVFKVFIFLEAGLPAF
jgi:hypothetical protein